MIYEIGLTLTITNAICIIMVCGSIVAEKIDRIMQERKALNDRIKMVRSFTWEEFKK